MKKFIIIGILSVAIFLVFFLLAYLIPGDNIIDSIVNSFGLCTSNSQCYVDCGGDATAGKSNSLLPCMPPLNISAQCELFHCVEVKK